MYRLASDRWRPGVLIFTAIITILGVVGGQCSPAFADAVISNGTVSLGVHDEGHLNVSGPPSAYPTYTVGVRFLPTNAEGVGAGCECEGWGVADKLSNRSGYANGSSSPETTHLVLESFTASSTAATSVVRVSDSAGDLFRVTHEYKPSAATPYLYEVNVTISNISSQVTEVLYRRVMDWDVEPTPFNEHVTITHYETGELVRTYTDGFQGSDPLVFYSSSDYQPGPVTDAGPADHGALFDFNFGTLAAGAAKTFRIYYGAAESEAQAIIALTAVGAEVYSFGQPGTEDGATLGTPNTFIFAFQGVGAAPVYDPPALTKTAGLAAGECVDSGTNLTYDVCLDNSANPVPYSDLALKDQLPSQTTFVSASEGGTFDPTGNAVVWTIDNLPAGDKGCAQLVLRIDASAGSAVTNTAEVAKAATNVARNASEAATAAETISTNIHGVSEAARESNQSAVRVDETARQLREIAADLQRTVAHFQTDGAAPNPSHG